MAAILISDFRTSPAVSSVEPVVEPRPPWHEVKRFSGAFALEMPALDGLAKEYRMHRHREGGGVKELMTWGSIDTDGLYIRVALYRSGRAGRASADPLQEVAVIASEAAIDAELTGPTGELLTKFGLLPLIDMTITSSEEPRTCLAVAGTWNDPRLDLVAWWCNPGRAIVARDQLACLLDRLSLISAGGDERLAQFFAKAELKRSFCGSARPLLGPSLKRPDDWILAKAEPKLRGTLRGR
jgi:hypothetical protein